MQVFTKKIKCKHCQGFFKRRYNTRGKKNPVYICSRVDNYNDCIRVTVREEFIVGLINRRFQRELSEEELRGIVDYIIVEDTFLMEIHFTNGDDPILLKGNFIQF